MIRFAWLRFRTQAAVGACVLAIAAIALLVTGIQLAHAYDAAVAVCKRQGNCAGVLNAFLTQGYFTAGKLLEAVGLAVPGLIGMFWGRRWSPASLRPAPSAWRGPRASPGPAGWPPSSPSPAWPPSPPASCSPSW
jgi:hypothetical protein